MWRFFKNRYNEEAIAVAAATMEQQGKKWIPLIGRSSPQTKLSAYYHSLSATSFTSMGEL
jgi:hypothetical protein